MGSEIGIDAPALVMPMKCSADHVALSGRCRTAILEKVAKLHNKILAESTLQTHRISHTSKTTCIYEELDTHIRSGLARPTDA
jgi:hypothetical protein